MKCVKCGKRVKKKDAKWVVYRLDDKENGVVYATERKPIHKECLEAMYGPIRIKFN